MYCSACASPITAGLKFCNRCGANLKKDEEVAGGSFAGGLITAVVMVALFGMGIMFGGAIALKNGGGFDRDLIAIFMTFCFLIIGTAEIFLLRQLSRVLGASSRSQHLENIPPLFQPAQSAPPRELHALRDMAEPIPSVTENTTRTLENSVREIRGR
ncbi:MAG TPA: zinc ribbon domain-containing protein [Pyrinomonadaceae bacterium]|nr:zinc ribbon domain-containing protein [Pyrinomonadaceae bacterium]